MVQREVPIFKGFGKELVTESTLKTFGKLPFCH
jgi:hypothetical protein